MSSFGDYDQCLSLSTDEYEDNNFIGKYCSFKVAPALTLNASNREIDRVLLEQVPVFEYYHIQQSICLPSTCSDNDVESLIEFVLRGLPLQRRLNLHCDTKETVSLKNKILNASTSQVIAG